MQTSSAAAVWWLFKRCSSIKTQQVRCLCKTHTSNLIWNSIPVHAKMMSVLANVFIESKKDWVSSEAQWAFDMSDSYESCVCVCAVVQMCHTFDLHIISILKGRRTYIYTEVAKLKTLARLLALPPSAKQNTQTRTRIESICFHLMTQLCFATAFTWDRWQAKRQLNCNQYATERTIQNDM